MEYYKNDFDKNIEIKEFEHELIKVLEKNGPLTRSQMVKILGKPRTTIYDHLSVLMEQNMIKKFTRQINARGRPSVFFKLKEN